MIDTAIETEPVKRRRGQSRASLDLVESARAILEEIQPASVRAVGYQLFTRKLIPSMARNEMNKLSRLLTLARENGTIPWEHIVDETREPERVNAWENPVAYIEAVKRSYRRDRWADQADRVEVWSEKGTVRGTLAQVLHDYGVTFRVMHGYASATAVREAAQEVLGHHKQGRYVHVLYVGDWDPSGLAMSELDLPERLERYGAEIFVKRVAIGVEDILEGTLPGFSADTKTKDPRHKWFVEEYGERCWELDAMDPRVLRERVEQAIREYIDFAAWERAEVVERAEKESLETILNAWPGSNLGLA